MNFFFIFHEELLYLLTPGTPGTDMASTAVTAAELCTTEVVADGTAHGTLKEP